MDLGTDVRLVVLTAGTLLPLFWMVVILGHRRQRNFERIFFFLCLSIFLIFGSSLLALNARLYYASPRSGVMRFCGVFLAAGLWFFPSLLVHLQVEYAEIRGLLQGTPKRIWVLSGYLPAVLLSPSLFAALRNLNELAWAVPSRPLGFLFQTWLVISLAIAAGWQWRFWRTAIEPEQRSFHRTLAIDLLFVMLSAIALHAARTSVQIEMIGGALGVLALVPLGQLIRNVQRFNFLQIGRQRNLIFAVFLAFVALLYLSFIRRASQWLDAYLPPESTAAILLFLPVVFFEPLQRFIGRRLRETAHREVGKVQELMGEIQQEARQGDAKALARFVERRLKEEFELAAVQVSFARNRETDAAGGERSAVVERATERGKPTVGFSEGKIDGAQALGDDLVGVRVEPHGAALSGETRAALELVCEQLPGALRLCWLIEEKLGLERQLAERERLALVGQMAASISHNLKNPLGSIKTILQLQLESPEMPASLAAETRMVLDEVGRLSTKLNQLLQFSRPAVRGGETAAHCNPWLVTEQVVSMLRPEADRRGVRLELAGRNGLGMNKVCLSSEALNDIVSNLVVNAIEATGRNGRVRVAATSAKGMLTVAVEDDGPGIPESSRDKILQPFFTTKSQGTGLGLAIVARRVAEAGADLQWLSPVHEGRGTRFEVTVRLED